MKINFEVVPFFHIGEKINQGLKLWSPKRFPPGSGCQLSTLAPHSMATQLFSGPNYPDSNLNYLGSNRLPHSVLSHQRQFPCLLCKHASLSSASHAKDYLVPILGPKKHLVIQLCKLLFPHFFLFLCCFPHRTHLVGSYLKTDWMLQVATDNWQLYFQTRADRSALHWICNCFLWRCRAWLDG